MGIVRRALRRAPAGASAVALACGGLAALSLVLPYSLTKDEWSWLVWGREVRQLDLQLAGGTLWKPLPVLFTMFVSAFDEAAPHLWLALVRAGWLLALIAAYRVGAHLGGRAAGVLGAALLLLTPNHAEWLAYFGRGSSEPLIVALVLWAIDRHLHGRPLQALALGSLAALGRPEPWPLIVAYAALVWRSERGGRRAAALALPLAVPVLWLGGGWWGSDEALPRPLHRLLGSGSGPDALGSLLAVGGAGRLLAGMALLAGAMVIAPVWAAAAFAFLRALPGARPPGQEAARVTIALGVGALVWTLTVIAGRLAGLPLAPRFLFAPAALISILGGVGMAQAVGAVRPGRRALVAAAIAAVTVPFAAARATELARWVPQGSWAPLSDPPWAQVLERAGAEERLAACGDEVRVRQMAGGSDSRTRAGKSARAEIAWRLGARLAWVDRLSVRRTPAVDRALVLVPAAVGVPRGRLTSSAREAAMPGRWRQVAAAAGWTVYEVGCRPR